EPLPGAEDYLAAEIAYACSHEGAMHLTDLMARRTRISIETWDRGVTAAPVAAAIAAEVLGWDADKIDYEVGLYLRRVEAERDSQLQLDDSQANAVRTRVPERPLPVSAEG
ncbi:MAG TPA: glycerol-3-phosphate dehydrogenase, partial [Candidatus Avipropionibacterium avicola]|nr:glycerol-3-phosphate dehydrogenase [Candidatus Avipropionibacterium avicola]